MLILSSKYTLLFLIVSSLLACHADQSISNIHSESLMQASIQLAEKVDLANLKQDIKWLAADAREGRKAGTAAEDEVGDWLTQRFKKMGLQPFKNIGLDNYEDAFEIKTKLKSGKRLSGENIVGVLYGDELIDEYIIVSAHYDHLGVKNNKIYNGADDNASGVAALLELARIFSKAGTKQKRTIVFIAFSAEEQNLQGAHHFCKHVVDQGLTEKFTGLNFEMFGAVTGQGQYLNIWNTKQTSSIVDAVYQASQAIRFPLLVTHAAGFKADAHALQACGIAATTMDVGGGAHFEDNHPHYHSASDRVEHVDESGLQKATMVGLIAAWLLANK